MSSRRPLDVATRPEQLREARHEPAKPVVELREVAKRFGEVQALNGVSLTIPEGGFFALLGPSGCGKTTLLRIIAGLEHPDAGQVVLDGDEITRVQPEKRPFNIVFQRYALFPHLTVAENVAFGLTTDRQGRTQRAERQQRVARMLELVGLRDYGDRHPKQLSGGQAQRVAVARALIRQPRLLLLDEPLSALDRNVRHGIREELLRIHAELGTTFVLVTHDQDEALSMSQEVALMNEGRIEQLADPETLYRNPATLFAARFVGAGTFLLARAIGRHGRHVEFELQGRRFHALDAGVEIGSTAEVLLRPEDLSLNRDRAVQVPGRVATCSFLGSYYELTVDSDLGRFRVRETHALAPGSPVEVGWPETAGIAYPRASDVGAEM